MSHVCQQVFNRVQGDIASSINAAAQLRANLQTRSLDPTSTPSPNPSQQNGSFEVNKDNLTLLVTALLIIAFLIRMINSKFQGRRLGRSKLN